METTPKNTTELEALKQKKLSADYKVNDMPDTVMKDLDFDKRIVQVIPNTYLFMDSEWDVLVPGCCKKSLADRGPGSSAKAKIKNVKDHNITQRIGVPQLIEERSEGKKHFLYAESYLMENTLGNDTLIEYQSGAIDQHSIGFRYRDLEFLTNEASEWNYWLDQLINPEKAEAAGFMYLVKEIELFEFSPVSFGANELTAYLGVKAKAADTVNYKKQCLLKISDRITTLEKMYRDGKQSDDRLQDFELQCLQLKQIIKELHNSEPSIKDTIVINSRQNTKDTMKGEVDFKQLLPNLSIT